HHHPRRPWHQDHLHRRSLSDRQSLRGLLVQRLQLHHQQIPAPADSRPYRTAKGRTLRTRRTGREYPLAENGRPARSAKLQLCANMFVLLSRRIFARRANFSSSSSSSIESPGSITKTRTTTRTIRLRLRRCVFMVNSRSNCFGCDPAVPSSVLLRPNL